MTFQIDFDASRKVADDVDLELARLKAEFEACDRAAYAASAAVRAQSGTVAEGIASVLAREGAHRTEPMAEAQGAVSSLRTALGWFEGAGDEIMRDAQELGQRLERAGEATLENAKHAFHQFVDGAEDAGRAVLDGVHDAGEAVVDGVHDAAEDIADGVGRLWRGVTGG